MDDPQAPARPNPAAVELARWYLHRAFVDEDTLEEVDGGDRDGTARRLFETLVYELAHCLQQEAELFIADDGSAAPSPFERFAADLLRRADGRVNEARLLADAGVLGERLNVLAEVLLLEAVEAAGRSDDSLR